MDQDYKDFVEDCNNRGGEYTVVTQSGVCISGTVKANKRIGDNTYRCCIASN